jgi:hypothetical protein
MWNWIEDLRKHKHYPRPVARYVVPQGLPGMLGGGVPHQVTAWRCFCGDVQFDLHPGRFTLAELAGEGDELAGLQRARDSAAMGVVQMSPPAPDASTPMPFARGGPVSVGGPIYVTGDGGASAGWPGPGGATGGPGGPIATAVQVPDWPDQVRPPEGGGGVVPHLPVTDPQSHSGWRCSACGLPIGQQLDEDSPWRTTGTGNEACDQGEAGWERHP